MSFTEEIARRLGRNRAARQPRRQSAGHHERVERGIDHPGELREQRP